MVGVRVGEGETSYTSKENIHESSIFYYAQSIITCKFKHALTRGKHLQT